MDHRMDHKLGFRDRYPLEIIGTRVVIANAITMGTPHPVLCDPNGIETGGGEDSFEVH